MYTATTDAQSLPVDPVCGMEVDPSTDLRTDHNGTTYFFCHPSCLERFTANPAEFLEPRTADVPVPGAIYTCPMHPEVRQDGPGSCPMCGMALEPERVTLDEGPNPELVDMTRRFKAAALLGAPVMLFAMLEMVAPAFVHGLVAAAAANWLQLALSIPVVFWAGAPLFARGWASIVHRSPNMFTLIALGIGAAFLYSVVATVSPGLFPSGFRMHGRVEPYFDTAVVVTALVLLGQVLELRARSRTSDGASRACWVSRHPTLAASTRTANMMCRSRRFTSAIFFACGQARTFRWTASSSTVTASWTSRWSPASPSRSRSSRLRR